MLNKNIAQPARAANPRETRLADASVSKVKYDKKDNLQSTFDNGVIDTVYKLRCR
jgi:YD repeat-containing protein